MFRNFHRLKRHEGRGELEKIRIGFFGYGTKALDALMQHPFYDVRYFIIPDKRLGREVYEAMECYKAELTIKIISNNRELARVLENMRDVECFLMNASPVILNNKVLEGMRFFNLHPGDLLGNRGHHPHLWTVLLGERKSRITLHAVGTAIDLGEVIGSVPVIISGDDNAGDVLSKLEAQIPVLLNTLYKYLREGVPCEAVVREGGYRRKMEYGDYKINTETDTPELIRRKIMARSLHHGAFIKKDNIRYYVDRIDKIFELPDGFPLHMEEMLLEVDEQNNVLYLDTGVRFYIFHLNKFEIEECLCSEKS